MIIQTLESDRFEAFRPAKKVLIGMLSLLFLWGGWAMGQDGAKKEKARLRMSLSYTKILGDGAKLMAVLKTKGEEGYMTVEGVSVNFFQMAVSDSTYLGGSVSNSKGEAVLLVQDDKALKTDTSGAFQFFATVQDEENFRDVEDDIAVNPAKLELKFMEGDSVNMIEAFFFSSSPDGEILPLADVPVGFFVQRSLSMLPFGGKYTFTNEEGKVTVSFPQNLPGDENGNLEIVALVDDHEDFGSFEGRKTMAWGVLLQEDDLLSQRALWARRGKAPIPFLFIAYAIILGTWSTIGFIIFQLIKVKKNSNSTG